MVNNNLLNNTKCYLIGPIEQSADPTGWRNRITIELNNMGVKVYDPMIKPSWAPKLSSEVNKNKFLEVINTKQITTDNQAYYDSMSWIRDVDLRYVHSSDFIVCYLPKIFSMGSGEELTVAAATGKPVLIWSDKDYVPSSWLATMLCKNLDEIKDVFFHDEKELITYLHNVDNNNIDIDPMKWVFLSYFNDVKTKKR